jgi:hypothetical protein
MPAMRAALGITVLAAAVLAAVTTAAQVPAAVQLRGVADVLLDDEVDTLKLADALGSRVIQRTEDKSPMRPNEQVYYAATTGFQTIRLSVERDKRWAAANPHTLYLHPAGFGGPSVAQLDQVFGVGRPGAAASLPQGTTRTWVYGPANSRFVAQIIAELPPAPAGAGNPAIALLRVRIDRR